MPDEEHGRTDSRTEATPVRILFDGGCSLCRREIDHYRRLRGAECLDWIDISSADVDLDSYGVNRRDAMARMHVQDATGHWHTGAWAFAEMWSHLPYYRWVARVLRRTGLLPIVDRGYVVFANWRLQRRCTSQACATTTPRPTAVSPVRSRRSQAPLSQQGE
jgi:predicted DCC family thiol-disulfide oxidoreductase YuxK